MHSERYTFGSARGHAKLPIARSARRACSTQPKLPTQLRGEYLSVYVVMDLRSGSVFKGNQHT
jgi:hypothetical protein